MVGFKKRTISVNEKLVLHIVLINLLEFDNMYTIHLMENYIRDNHNFQLAKWETLYGAFQILYIYHIRDHISL